MIGRLAAWWSAAQRTGERLGALEAQVHALERQALAAQRDSAALRAKVARLAAGQGGVGDGRRVGLDPDVETLDAH